MSIIHDALKKVQNSRQPPVDSDRPVSGAPETPPAYLPDEASQASDRSFAIPKPVLFILMAVIFIAVFVIFFILFRLAHQTTLHPKIVSEMPPATLTVSVSVDEPPPSAGLPLDALKLEGIMNMGDKKIALINGRIYEEGQAIDGVAVVRITGTDVTVQENGVEKLLRIQ